MAGTKPITITIENLNEESRLTIEKFLKFEHMMKSSPPESSQLNRPPYHELNAAPLGLCAFALTTFIASMYLAGASVPINASLGVVMGPALCYGGLIQLLAGLLEFRNGNNLLALIFCSYGGFWLSFAALHILSFNFLGDYHDANALNNALGVFFLAWTIYTTLMLISVLRTNFVTISLFVFLVICLSLLTASKFLQSHYNLQRAAGAFGILTASIAWYSAIAHLLSKKNWFFQLPVFEVSRLRRQINNDIANEIANKHSTNE
ncbi:unnamed protein product [Rotaria socialis]|uniref:Uncharacterized protein n=1 Tax=Rotaria socialis TaxID=392032 RepID=A0A820WFU2_9BILA|nr:unnamed protein product [Rotaria socialis]CAF3663584.1 unnamed protein product [Rotaria socialis]CAF4514159.1 unnamed protein product [Rotaria socialis]CAF4754612.1 unnamed protein product [Rotaria socialis]